MEKMNPEVKQMWLEALRSGRYKQDIEKLRTKNGYCCLGVLCDLYPKTDWDISETEEEYSFYGEDEFLPKEVAEWANLKGYTEEKAKWIGTSHISLAYMNDIQGKTFEEIAEYIEKSL